MFLFTILVLLAILGAGAIQALRPALPAYLMARWAAEDSADNLWPSPFLSYLRKPTLRRNWRDGLGYDIAAVLLPLLAVSHFGLNWQGALAFVFAWVLVLLAYIDLDTQLLPDVLTLPLAAAGLLVNAAGVFTSPGSALAGLAGGYLLPVLAYHVMRYATGEDALGRGDCKLLAAIGAWLGWLAVPNVLLVACLLAGVERYVSMRKTPGVELGLRPFGPALVAGTLLTMLLGFNLMA